MFNEFKTFLMRGNVIDLAVAVIIGAAFGAIVTSAVNDVIMPPIGLIPGNVDFKDMFLSLYGQFLNMLINFVIIGFVIFMVVRAANKIQKPAEVAVTMEDCSFAFPRFR
jgi:large conductance mechanosensitive channel